MKTFDEWVKQFKACVYEWLSLSPEELKQIQLDAMKEGMRRAAQLNQKMMSNGDYPLEDYYKNILSAAEQLTEKDLA